MSLPEILKKQITLRLGIAMLSQFLFLAIMVFLNDWILALPCAVFGLLMIEKGISLLYNCIKGNYLEIRGICCDVEVKKFTKKIKAVTLKAEDKLLKIFVYGRLKNINVGDCITMYMSKEAQLYYENNHYITENYYAILVRKEM